MPEYRCWVKRTTGPKWVPIQADTHEQAQACAKNKYGQRLISVKPIVKGKN